MRRKNLIKVLLIGLLVFLKLSVIQPASAAGASLFLSPSAGTYVVGGSFAVKVLVDTGGQAINAAEGTISFDKNLLEVASISESSSIFSIWIDRPSLAGGKSTIIFQGGATRPGYLGEAGLLFTINFKAIKAGLAQARFSAGAALANDENGTNILTSMGSASFIISPKVEAPDPGELGKEPADKDSASLNTKNEEAYNEPIITSSTHPDQEAWYKERGVKLNWKLPEPALALRWGLSQEPEAEPDQEPKDLFSEKEFPEIGDGVWYFSLKFKDSKRWGTTARQRVMVDTKPPVFMKAEVSEAPVGSWPILDFEAVDEGSGLDRYEIIIDNLRSESLSAAGDDNSLKLAGLEPGPHRAIIKAKDKAGNLSYAEADFEILPIASPQINGYPQEIKPSDGFYLSGTALPGADVYVYFIKDEKVIRQETAKSDNGGNWLLVSSAGFENGRHAVFAVAANENGVKSLPSPKVTFLVTPPVFVRIGSVVINYFTVFASLLFIVILIVVLIIYAIGLVRRRLVKETAEAEDMVRRRLEELKDLIDEEFARLDAIVGTKNYTKERLRSKLKLKKEIESAEQKISKEVKDVEELLK